MNVEKELTALRQMNVKDLRTRYAEVWGEETRTGNKVWLIKRIIWRMQALEEGDLSERARKRAAELANDADLRTTAPKPQPVTLPTAADSRLPSSGTIITRHYKGDTLQVKVLAKGFEYLGEVYKSLSAVAKKITGQHCNGYLFFKLGGAR